ncbi:MAG: indole-3-glycerol phosphate synthase TrpC [Candidatus Binataceae bacterium]
MASILDQIFAAKRQELEMTKAAFPPSRIIEEAKQSPAARPFISSLRKRPPAIIAEIKRASPSKGDILAELDPATVARDYELGGAAAISVLTDRHFKGSLDDLRAVRRAVELPLLRKDFIFDPYQVYEARAAGADAILLIAAMLDIDQLGPLAALAKELGMAALVEAHNRGEFDAAERVHTDLIGINNRDLHTFKTDIATSVELIGLYWGSALIVSESGIETPADIRRLYEAGARAFLIGEGLLRGGTPREALKSLAHALDHKSGHNTE